MTPHAFIERCKSSVPWALRPTRILHTVIHPLALTALEARARTLPRSGRPVGVERVDGVVVINLDTRKDRFARVTKEMDRLGITARRFEAIREGEGILGCTLSHAACVRMMIEEGWNHVLICEDDLSFRVSRRQLDALIESFLGDRYAEVACFAFHLQSPPTPRNLLFFRTRDTQTTACYLVKRSIAPDLLATFEAGVDGLRRGGHRAEYGVDMVWKRLQTERVFVVPTIRIATQVPGYSDVMGLDMTYRV